MPRLIHPVAGGVALTTIVVFWTATLLSEALGPPAAVVAVKTAIPWGFLVLIPAMAAAGGSGMLLARSRRGPLVAAKQCRMRLAALNGLLVLVPSALFLAARARAGTFDAAFYAVQALELAAGAVNMALLGRSLRDGLRISGRLASRAGGAPSGPAL